MTLTLIYGGTFDPVHNGHLRVAKQLVDLFQDATVNLVPCHVPPHRDEPSAGADDRLQMLKLAVGESSELSIDSCELDRPGPSYSLDTLIDYRGRLGEVASIGFVMGMDSWETLPTWHEWQQLTDFAHLVVVSRPGYDGSMSDELAAFAENKITKDSADLLSTPAGRIFFAALPESDVSATELRHAIQAGAETGALLPPPVATYINTRGLYSSAG